MTYGPFDLSTASAAYLFFYCWYETEPFNDYFAWGASIDNETYYDYEITGSSEYWVDEYINFSDVPDFPTHSLLGYDSVWIHFYFFSDDYLTYQGAFVDDIVLMVNTSGPIIDSIDPPGASAGTGDVVTINGQRFGVDQGSSYVTFTFGYLGLGLGEMEGTVPPGCWSNDQIVVIVPTISGNLAPSSGPLRVHTDRGSAQYDFEVTFSYSGHKWTGANPICVDYEINANTPDVDDEYDEITAAAQTWNDVYGANFIFNYIGSTGVLAQLPQFDLPTNFWRFFSSVRGELIVVWTGLVKREHWRKRHVV